MAVRGMTMGAGGFWVKVDSILLILRFGAHRLFLQKQSLFCLNKALVIKFSFPHACLT